MFNNEILDNGIWQVASSHTVEADRDIQFQRFLDSGIPEENLRKAQD